MAKKGKVENLIPLNKRTKDEQRKIQKKGGTVSGQKRKRKLLLKEVCEDIMVRNCSVDVIEKIIKKYIPDIDGEDLTYNYALAISILNKAISKGNAKCAEFIRDTMGQKPVEQQVIAFDENNELVIDLDDEDE